MISQNLSLGIELNPKLIIDHENDFNFSAGVYTYRDLTEKFQISTGLHIQNDQFDIFNNTLTFGSFVDPNTGLLDTTKFAILEASHSAWFIGIPIQNRYKLIGEKKHVYINFGLAIWIRVMSKIKGGLNINDQEFIELNEKSELFKKTAWSGNFGLGYEFPFTNRLKAYIEPRADFSFLRNVGGSNSYVTLEQYFSRRYRFGLGMTIGLRFY